MGGWTYRSRVSSVLLFILVLFFSSAFMIPSPALPDPASNQFPPTGKVNLNGVCALNAWTAWAVGDVGTVLGFNGSSWSRRPSGTGNNLYDVTATSTDNAWAVGAEGEVLHFDGSTWTTQEQLTEEDLVSITALDPSHIWAATGGGSIFFYDGLSWSLEACGIFPSLSDIEALDVNDVWAVGTDGTTARYDGISWSRADVLPENGLSTLSGCGQNNLWGLDTNGEILRLVNSSWSPQHHESEVVVVDVLAPDFVWAVDTDGSILVFDGERWSIRHRTGLDGVTAIAGLDADIAWAVGQEGDILSFGMEGYQRQSIHTLWYFAEGSTAHGFEEYLLIVNPNPEPVEVSITYFTNGDTYTKPTFEVGEYSRTTIDVSQDVPDSDVAAQIVTSDQVACERAMYWNGRVDGHCAPGQTYASPVWYLAEGTTREGFEEWICLANATGLPAHVTIDYYTESSVVKKDELVIDPWSRSTIDAESDVGKADIAARVTSDVPIVVERSMYWDGRRGGHCSPGAVAPREIWFLAEGSTSHGFSEWILMLNPSSETARVGLDLLTPAGLRSRMSFTLEPESRFSLEVARYFQGDHATAIFSDIPIVVERSMYWDNGTGRAGHNSPATDDPRNTWYFAEGCTDYGFDEYITIANPYETSADVYVNYMDSQGSTWGGILNLAAYSRVNLYVNTGFAGRDASISLESDLPVVAERSLYWDGRGGGHCSVAFGP